MATKAIDELKECPFCGGKAYYTETVNGTEMVRVGCATCGVSMKAFKPRNEPPSKDIVAAWNQRYQLHEDSNSEKIIDGVLSFKHQDGGDFSGIDTFTPRYAYKAYSIEDVSKLCVERKRRLRAALEREDKIRRILEDQ